MDQWELERLAAKLFTGRISQQEFDARMARHAAAKLAAVKDADHRSLRASESELAERTELAQVERGPHDSASDLDDSPQFIARLPISPTRLGAGRHKLRAGRSKVPKPNAGRPKSRAPIERASPDPPIKIATSGDLAEDLASPLTAELGDVTLDLDRQRRCGFAEVVFGESKPVETLVRIFQRLLEERQPVLATRVSAEKAESLAREFENGRYNPLARTFRIDQSRPLTTSGPSAANPSDNATSARSERPTLGLVAIITAGTSDIPVAEEVRETADWMGAGTDLIHDVGVAGPQRLLAQLPRITQADAVVVVAGMEAALASVVGGHVACPVIAVPTSVGYGASFGGLAALLGMLNCCAANVAVVNIDAGFKAGYIAGMIAVRRGMTRS